MLKRTDNKQMKDKKIKFFLLKSTGTAAATSQVRSYLRDSEGAVAEFWAYYRSLSGNEYFSANADQKRRTAEFIVNYNTDITDDHLIEDNGNVYSITFLDDKEGYKGDIKLSVVQTDKANEIPAEVIS